MSKNTPSLKTLSAFEAVVKSGNLSKAAKSLGITHSAVSQSIKGLEQLCGCPILKRNTRNIELTDTGKIYYQEISMALNQIRRATQQVLSVKNTLSVNMPTSFAVRWFNPRFEDFLAENPNIDLKISMLRRKLKLSDFNSCDIDISIDYGRSGNWPGCIEERFAGDKLVLAAAPELVKKIKLSNTSDIFHKFKSLIISQSIRRDDYLQWCSRAGVAIPDSSQHVYYTNTVQAINAALRGEGLVVTHKIFIKDELSSGFLIQPIDIEANTEEAYYLVYPEEKKGSISVQLFTKWIQKGNKAWA
jgi:LysR family transcriptional regulator, glycine cleavage system transcriptional activator